MRLLLYSLGFSLLAACSSGTSIKDLPDMNVSKAPAQWSDPGAVPDLPRDAGPGGAMDAAADAGADAGPRDGGVADAQAADSAIEAGSADAG